MQEQLFGARSLSLTRVEVLLSVPINGEPQRLEVVGHFAGRRDPGRLVVLVPDDQSVGPVLGIAMSLVHRYWLAPSGWKQACWAVWRKLAADGYEADVTGCGRAPTW